MKNLQHGIAFRQSISGNRRYAAHSFLFLVLYGYGEKNLRRGIIFNLLGLLISIITLVVVPAQTIWFGILNFMGCAILLTLPLEKLLKKIPAIYGMAICFLLFLLCKQIQFGQIGITGLLQIQVPNLLYNIKILTPLGFPHEGFIQVTTFLFFRGYFYIYAGFILIRYS